MTDASVVVKWSNYEVDKLLRPASLGDGPVYVRASSRRDAATIFVAKIWNNSEWVTTKEKRDGFMVSAGDDDNWQYFNVTSKDDEPGFHLSVSQLRVLSQQLPDDPA